jgi:sugar transferase (PEP-CTERM system associated)
VIKLFSHWLPSKSILQIALDLFLPIICALLSVFMMGLRGQENLQIVLLYAMIFALAMIVLNGWLGLYHRAYAKSLAQTRVRTALSLSLSVPVPFAAFSVHTVADVNQRLLLIAGLAALFGTFAHRFFAMHARVGALLVHRTLIFGTGLEAIAVSKVIQKSDPEMQIVGFYPSPDDTKISTAGQLTLIFDTGPETAAIDKAPNRSDSELQIVGLYPSQDDTKVSTSGQLILPRSQSLSAMAHVLNVDEIIIAVHERRGGVLPMRELLDCKLSGVNVLDLASYFERTLGQIRLDSLHAGWLVFSEGFRQGWRRSLVKRVFDIVTATILLSLALPVMAVTAILIVLEDGFPIIYRQERVGFNGHLFNVVKFRSMRKNAESDGKPRWATANDDRTTRVGRIIRKLRIDELPQLVSVLAGKMSLVGPRPERPYFVDQLTRDIPFYGVRHSVKPGVTGWAQVNYHYGASVDDSIQKLQYDLYYVKNHTLFLDIVILFETIGVVLTGKGAQ